MASSKSKILFIGGTGYIGKYIVEASILAGHPTFVLVRESTLLSDSKAQVIGTFKSLGVDFVFGDLYDHKSLVEAIKKVDVVISTVGLDQLPDQDKIIAAIKEAGNVKRFFPSEFGNDVDRVHAVETVKTAFAIKANIRRAVEAEGIPYTYVSSNLSSGYFLPTLSQPEAAAPPRDTVTILGDGNPKAIFNKEEDIGTYTIRAVEDLRTLNKILYVRPLVTSTHLRTKFLTETDIAKNMGKRGRAKRAPNPQYGSQKHLSLREEKIGKKQTNPINVKSKLKLEHLQSLAVWAGGQASVPSLAAFFWHRLAADTEALGLQSDPSLFSCQRCETMLQHGFNCTVHIEKNQVKARHRRKKHKFPSQNNVVYNCYFCSFRNLKRGTPKGHMKEICPPKEKQASRPECSKSTSQKSTVLETETRSKDEVTKLDEVTLPAIAGDAPVSNSPVTPSVRTKLTLEVTKRKRNKSGTKKLAESESNSAAIDAEKTAGTSTKRRRKSWTSLKEIAERSGHDNSRNITNSTIPFSSQAP